MDKYKPGTLAHLEQLLFEHENAIEGVKERLRILENRHDLLEDRSNRFSDTATSRLLKVETAIQGINEFLRMPPKCEAEEPAEDNKFRSEIYGQRTLVALDDIRWEIIGLHGTLRRLCDITEKFNR